MVDYETCPGCEATLPRIDGPTHRYIGASPSCWAIFTALVNANEPPIAPTPANALIADAYAAQHPGTPSPQAIQSVAVHLLTLYGVLVRGMKPENVMWIRLQAVKERGRFDWLTPPSFAGSLTISDIARAPTPQTRAEQVHRYVDRVWSIWARDHAGTIAAWYNEITHENLTGIGC